MKNMIKAIIFDADGTLYNAKTQRAYSLSAEFLSKKTGIPRETINTELKKTINDIKSTSHGLFDPEKRQRKYALEKTLLNLGAEKEKIVFLVPEALNIFWNTAIRDLEIFPEVAEVLGKLAGKYDLVVTSEEFRDNLILKLDHVFGGWKKYFKILITPEETGIMKPSEKYYLKAMEKLDLRASEIFAVGDSEERDIEPAKKLGIKALKITPNEFLKVMDAIQTME
jgi:HAD superfamily hydrolase (TIGR01549 family)